MRFKSLFIAAAIALSLSSCSSSSTKTAYHQDGRMKPKTAVLPVQDKSGAQVGWNMGSELTTTVTNRLVDDGKLYVMKAPSWAQVNDVAKVGSADLASLKGEEDFIVMMELVEHKVVPYEWQKIKPLYPTKGHPSSVLMMSMRVKVFDMRGSNPKVVLQEVFSSNHLIPKSADGINYSRVKWGMDDYISTPYGKAHARMARDIAERLEEYISIAQTY